MIKINFSGQFNKMLDQISDSEELADHIDTRITLFRKNPRDTRLDNHALTKRMKGKWAFSITDDIRIVYIWTGDNTVSFLSVGTHKQVYGR